MPTSASGAQALTDLDEHLLQYRHPGKEGECDLVIGLDFGTSASKVVIQVTGLPGNPAYAVDFGELAPPSMKYLLPSKLWVTADDACYPKEHDGAQLVNDIKLELFCRDELYSYRGATRQGYHPEFVAIAYLARLLRHSRAWFLLTNRDLVRHFTRLNWSVNLGVPSPCISDNEENRTFRRVGKAAWMLSVLEEHITLNNAEREYRLIGEAPEYWDRDDDGICCDFDIVPEIAAGAVGYAKSPFRREGVHVMMDVGASTVDVCSFLLRQREGDDVFPFLTADVQPLGTIRLHHERILAVRSLVDRQAQDLRDKHDPLAPISIDLEPYFLSRNLIESEIQKAEKELHRECSKMLWRAIVDMKMRRAPNEDVWHIKQKLPVLCIGGGSKLPFFTNIVNDLNLWVAKHAGIAGIDRLPLPVPETLQAETNDYHRLAVAWGLSHPSFNIGTIVPLDQIPDTEPPKKREKRNLISEDPG
jgi:hypothetical protein